LAAACVAQEDEKTRRRDEFGLQFDARRADVVAKGLGKGADDRKS